MGAKYDVCEDFTKGHYYLVFKYFWKVFFLIYRIVVPLLNGGVWIDMFVLKNTCSLYSYFNDFILINMYLK